MPVEATTVEYVYIGDGVTTVFDFPSKFMSNADIAVGLDRVEQSSGFTVAGAGASGGGTVTFTTAPAAGSRVALLRRPPASQLVDFVNGQTILEGTLDTALDKLTMVSQYLLREIQKCIRVSEFDPSVIDVLPFAETRANRLLGFSSDGKAVSVVDITDAVAVTEAVDAAAASAASAAASEVNAGLSETSVLVHKEAAEAAAGSSAADATVAAAARDAAVLAGNVFASTAAGVSATAVGSYFSVPSTSNYAYLDLYRVDAGPVATLVKSYQTSQAPIAVSSSRISLTADPSMLSVPPNWTFSIGAGSGSRYGFDKFGVFRAFGATELRHVYDAAATGGDGSYLGILLENFWSANVIRNGDATGAVAGSPGTLPTNWSDNATSVGLTRTVIRSGYDRGIGYVEVRYQGTPTSASMTILHDAAGAITGYPNSSGGTTAVASGQKWTASARTKVKSNTGVSAIAIAVEQYGTEVETSGRLPREAAYRRGHATYTLTSGVTSISAATILSMTVGAAVDITLRIAQVMLEPLGFASSYIPTTGAAAGRPADTISMSGTMFSALWPSNNQGTLFFEGVHPYHISDGAQRGHCVITSANGGGRLAIEGSNLNDYVLLTNWNGTSSDLVANLPLYNPLPGRITRTAVRFGTDDIAAVRDNFWVNTDTSAAVFSVSAAASIGLGGSRPIIFREVQVWPTKMSNDQLRALAKNLTAYTFVDEFNRGDSSTLGSAPNKSTWVQYGVGDATGVVTARIESGAVVATDSGQATTAAYNGIDFGKVPKRMAGIFRIVPSAAGNTNVGCSMTLISNANGVGHISDITYGSIHNSIQGTQYMAGKFIANVLTTENQVFSTQTADSVTMQFAGWEILDGELWMELPDGRALKAASAESYAQYAGRYLTWENYWTSAQANTIIEAAMAA